MIDTGNAVGDAAPALEAVEDTNAEALGGVSNRLVVSVWLCEYVGSAFVAVKVVDGNVLIVRPTLVSRAGSRSLYGAASMVKLGMRRSSHVGGSPGMHFIAAIQHQPFPQSTGEGPQNSLIERFAASVLALAIGTRRETRSTRSIL